MPTQPDSRKEDVLKELELKQTSSGWECNDTLRQATGGLTYAQMVELAEKARFRHALWQMGEAIADLFAKVVERSPLLQRLPK